MVRKTKRNKIKSDVDFLIEINSHDQTTFTMESLILAQDER